MRAAIEGKHSGHSVMSYRVAKPACHLVMWLPEIDLR